MTKLRTKKINGCYVVVSHKGDEDGYAQIKRNGKHWYVHRLVWTNHYGKIPEGNIIRHLCNNKLCINPAHLAMGTHSDNVQDRVDAGNSARGEHHGRAKLTEGEVCKIFADLFTPKMRLAREYGVCPKNIRNIKQGITWRHVTNTLTGRNSAVRVAGF